MTLAILALIVFALSLWADYKWRQWLKSRHETRPDQPPPNPTNRNS
jgi:hypothetical protein